MSVAGLGRAGGEESAVAAGDRRPVERGERLGSAKHRLGKRIGDGSTSHRVDILDDGTEIVVAVDVEGFVATGLSGFCDCAEYA